MQEQGEGISNEEPKQNAVEKTADYFITRIKNKLRAGSRYWAEVVEDLAEAAATFHRNKSEMRKVLRGAQNLISDRMQTDQNQQM